MPPPIRNERQFLTLSRFLLRQETIALYRQFLRLIHGMHNEQDFRVWIRDEFKQNVHLSDEQAIRMQLSRGRAALKELENTVQLSGKNL